jgi:PD-(D/E)XK nuclease superfamily
MVYSYTQISQYLRCPRSYRYRYLDGWREKETRAAMVFGRCFEKALGAYFCQEDSSAALFKEGMHTAMVPLNTVKESLGTASSTKASICSKHLHGIIAYAFPVRNRVCKLK